MFKIKFDLPNSIDIAAVGRWIYTGAVDLHRDGGGLDLHRGGGRWIYIEAVDLHRGGGFTYRGGGAVDLHKGGGFT